jgi:hypothetical protein
MVAAEGGEPITNFCHVAAPPPLSGWGILVAERCQRRLSGTYGGWGVSRVKPRATLLRVVLAVVVATATCVREGYSQSQCGRDCPNNPIQRPGPPLQVPGGSTDSGNNKNLLWYVVGGAVIVVVVAAIAGLRQLGDPGPQATAGGGGGGGGGGGAPPNLPPIAQLPPSPPAPQAPAANQAARALKPSCNLPPVGETRYTNHVVADMDARTTNAQLEAFGTRHRMTRMETMTLRLTGRRLHLWRIDDGTSMSDMITNICNETVGVQPNYLFELTQAQSEPANSDQYAPAKLNLVEAHRLARGNRILIAVIDSEVDASHPDLAGAIVGNFDASADDERPHSHGTGMAGAIAARHNMLGTAPSVGLLTVRAFSMRANTAEGTTFNILKGLDWAAAQGARIVNMSFAGPADPRLHDALEKAYKKGMVLIAAAGNAGPRSPPLYPGADKNVIAVTATDVDDALFSGANRGDYVAVAAPGVDILAPAPDGAYSSPPVHQLPQPR